MTDSHLLRMELVKELKEVALLIKANKEAGEILLCSLTWLNRYCEKNHIPPPDGERIASAMTRIESLLNPSDDSYHRDESDAKLPEPR